MLTFSVTLQKQANLPEQFKLHANALKYWGSVETVISFTDDISNSFATLEEKTCKPCQRFEEYVHWLNVKIA